MLATFARLPGLEPPDPQRLPFVRTVDMDGDEAAGIGRYPAQEGAFYPALVSAVDGDGNETAGIRMPDIAVPVGTHDLLAIEQNDDAAPPDCFECNLDLVL